MRGSETLHIEARLLQCVDERLDRVGFAVARRANKQNAAFPWDVVLFIQSTRGKELYQVITNLLLEIATHDQVIEGCILDVLEEMFIFVPLTVVEYQHLAAYFHIPLAYSGEEATIQKA